MFSQSHLVDIDSLTVDDIKLVLETSKKWMDYRLEDRQQSNPLAGITQINAFFENSTRTKVSFELAGRQLGAHVINFDASSSSLSKGETFEDTILTLDAMSPNVIVLRHTAEDAAKNAALLARSCVIVNAGTGTTSHPTQALLDAFTMQSYKGTVEGQRVVICGDIRHSRVAASNIKCLRKLGASVALAGPKELLLDKDPYQVDQFTDFDKALDGADVVMMLRFQWERMASHDVQWTNEYRSQFTSEYLAQYQLTAERLKKAKPGASIMHPGPINHNCEIVPELVHSEHSLILQQVQSGTAVRMACLDLLTRHLQ